MSFDLIHLGFRVSARESHEHELVLDDFEILAGAVDCARLLDGRGWVDVRLCKRMKESATTDEELEAEIDWRKT